MEGNYINAIGRRKTAVARIYMKEGAGKTTVNGKEAEEYFTVPEFRLKIRQPLAELDLAADYDIKAVINGGGKKGQAEALRLAVARALIKIDPEYKKSLKKQGYLVRDPRKVERKKPGQPKARKKFQFSKR